MFTFILANKLIAAPRANIPPATAATEITPFANSTLFLETTFIKETNATIAAIKAATIPVATVNPAGFNF